MIPEAYPPLTQWMVQLREDIEVQKAWLEILEERLDVYEELLKEVLKEKKHGYDRQNRREEADH